MPTYALITMVESNENCLNEQKGFSFKNKRLYEDEAILCFENWRKNGAWLKNISIYCYCPTKNIISEKTKRRFQELNVIYIEEYHKETETFLSGFCNVPFCGMLLEASLEEDILIHIDLDMNLRKALPRELVDSVESNEFVICGQHCDVSSQMQRKLGSDWENPLDTGFIISHRESGFYKFFHEKLAAISKTGGDRRWKEHCLDVDLYFLEEYVIDKAFNMNEFPIRPIVKYQLGEGYARINTYTDQELRKVYFWHEHILYDEENYDKIKQKIEFFKRTRKNHE